MFKRPEYKVIKTRLEEPRKFLQVVMGARQMGKSTVVKQVLNDLDLPYRFFSADNVPASDNSWISGCWAAVRTLKDSQHLDTMILVIDEIQKIPNWSEAVKKEWVDNAFHDRDIRVLLLGSSRVMLEKGLSESLAGRFEVFYWRDGNDEVDYVLRNKGSVVAIEVKSNQVKQSSGLETFRVKFNPKRAFIIGEGGIGIEEFLSMDLNSLF